MNENENGIFNEDCIEGSKKHIPDESVDLFIGDPPFGIKETSLKNVYARDNNDIIPGYQEAPADYEKFAYESVEEVKRILKPNGSGYIITGYNHEHHFRNAIDSLGMHFIGQIIWIFSFGMNTKKKFVVSHCPILYFKKSKKAKPTFNTHARFHPSQRNKNKRSLLYADLQDVWFIKREYHRGIKRNLTKLPMGLIKKMIQYSSNEGDLVCDFFLGNFTTAFVAKGLNRKFTGFEINAEAYNHFMPIYNKTKYGEKLSEADIERRRLKNLEDQLFE